MKQQTTKQTEFRDSMLRSRLLFYSLIFFNFHSLILPRDAMHARPMSSCGVSVCVSVTIVGCVETNKHIFKIFSPPSKGKKVKVKVSVFI